LAVVATSAHGVSAQTSGAGALLDAFLQTKDVAAGEALFAGDATVRIVPPPPNTTGIWSGDEQIHSYLAFRLSKHVSHERIGDYVVSGDTAIGTFMVRNDDFDRLQVGAVRHTLEIVAEGGKIKSITSMVVPEERPRLAEAAARLAAAPPAGMPRTGSGDLIVYPIALLAALSVVGMGALLSRRRHAEA
jgi:hypothetical protein